MSLSGWLTLSVRSCLVAGLALALGLAAPGPAVAQAPAKPQAKGGEADKAKAAPKPAAKIDLNRATAAEMVEALPGVGEATAAKIVAGRPYTGLDGLEKAGIPARTIDGLKGLVTFGTAADPRAKARAKPAEATPRTPVNLNTATKAQLEALPGIGPVKADAIIKARPFKAREDIMKVDGIKQGIYDQIKGLIRVD